MYDPSSTWGRLSTPKPAEAIMKHYAGLDVSLDETSICIVDETGAYIMEGKAALADYLQATGLGRRSLASRACS